MKKSDVYLVNPFNALPSWGGYEKQGHVALFVALKKIYTLFQEGIGANLGEYSLEIEGTEDLSIKHRDNYLTIHQVKTGDTTLSNDAKFCFITTLLQHQAERGYFHINPNATFNNNLVCATKKEIERLKLELSREIRCEGDVPDSKDEDSFIIVEKITASRGKKGNMYSILKFVLSQEELNIDKKNVACVVARIKCKLDILKHSLYEDSTLKDDTWFYNVCTDALDAKEESIRLLEELLGITDESWDIGVASSADKAKYCSAVYDNIHLLLKNELEKAIDNKEDCCRISLESIYEKINIDITTEQNSIPHQYRLVWKNIIDAFEKYPYNECCPNSRCNICATVKSCNLHIQFSAIKSICKEHTAEFLYKLLLKTPKQGDPSGLPEPSDISSILCSLVKEVDSLSLGNNYIISTMKDGLLYRSSLNTSRKTEQLQQQFAN